MKWNYFFHWRKWFPNASAVTWSLVLQAETSLTKLKNSKCDDFSGEISQLTESIFILFCSVANATSNSSLYKCCSGFCIDLLRQLSTEMGFDYELSEVEDEIWGAPDQVGYWIDSPSPFRPAICIKQYPSQLCCCWHSIYSGVSLCYSCPHSKHRHGLPICVVTTMHGSETEVYGANNTEQIKLSLSLGDWLMPCSTEHAYSSVFSVSHHGVHVSQ
jgi:uncharacterized protein YihD (DUF1040 family)